MAREGCHITLQQLRYVITIAEQKSIHKAAQALFITQPSLSSAVKELELEFNIQLFMRSNRGIKLTPEGEEFLIYARQMIDHYRLIEERYKGTQHVKEKFSVSMQHYTFAVEAFMKLAKQYDMEDYEFAVYETKTYEVIENVASQKSEIGVIYINDFNEKVISKILREKELSFIELFECDIYVYLWKNHPLASRESISFEDLTDYPCLCFEQGENNSFYFAEEVFSTYDYKKIIRAYDRATLLNLMVGMNGYTLCSGIICEELNGSEYCAIPFETNEKMRIGYVKNKKFPLTRIAGKYIEELEKYKVHVL